MAHHSRQEFPVKQAHTARQELLASQELHGRPVLLRKPDHHTLHPHQMPQHSLTQTLLLSFEEAYRYYTQGGYTSYQPEGSTGYGHGQGFYYPSGMGTSHGPQVGPSASARFEYDNPLTRELSGLTARMGALELRQEELGHSLDHNTSLT